MGELTVVDVTSGERQGEVTWEMVGPNPIDRNEVTLGSSGDLL